MAVKATIPGEEGDPVVSANRHDVAVIGLWSVRSGQQVATVRVVALAGSAVGFEFVPQIPSDATGVMATDMLQGTVETLISLKHADAAE